MIALPPRADSPTFLADWVELELLFGERRYLSQADLLDLLDDDPGSDRIDEEIARLEALYGEEINDEFVAEQRGRAREQEEEGLGRNEQLVEAVWLELSFRQQVVGATYPVAFEDGLLVITGSWGESVIYAFLAMLSARVTYSLSLPTGPPARRFEEVVSIALKTYTGGQSVRFGWPHDRNEFPSDFRTAARQLAHQLGERPGGMEAIGTNAKDYALDVVAWRGFDDGRRGQHVLLCQCATGKDWNEKMLSGRAWEKVIDFAVAPTCSVAFPFVPPRDDEEIAAWLDVAIKGGVPFDRLRLASLTRDDYADAELLGNLRTWVGEAQQALPRDD